MLNTQTHTHTVYTHIMYNIHTHTHTSYVYALYVQVLVPRSVANGSVFPAIAVQYGHGLFGDQASDS